MFAISTKKCDHLKEDSYILFQLLLKTFYCSDHVITEFGITDKNPSTAYVI